MQEIFLQKNPVCGSRDNLQTDTCPQKQGRMESHVILITVTVIFHASLSHGCSCRFKHNQADFCDSDIVIAGTVVGEEELVTKQGYVSQVTYTVNVNQVFKNLKSNAVRVGNTIQVYTAGEASTCGVWLSNQTKYLLNVLVSRVHPVKYYISKCRWIQPFDTLSSNQQKGLLKNFQLNCECALGIEIYPKWPGFGHFLYPCSYDLGYSMECYTKHSVCRSSGMDCRWEVDTNAADCRIKSSTTIEMTREFH